mgnify:CR=1 FL=1
MPPCARGRGPAPPPPVASVSGAGAAVRVGSMVHSESAFFESLPRSRSAAAALLFDRAGRGGRAGRVAAGGLSARVRRGGGVRSGAAGAGVRGPAARSPAPGRARHHPLRVLRGHARAGVPGGAAAARGARWCTPDRPCRSRGLPPRMRPAGWAGRWRRRGGAPPCTWSMAGPCSGAVEDTGQVSGSSPGSSPGASRRACSRAACRARSRSASARRARSVSSLMWATACSSAAVAASRSR